MGRSLFIPLGCSCNRGGLFPCLSTEKPYNREAFKQTLKKIWRPVKKIWVKDLGSKILLVEFEDHQEKARVQCEGPWSFDRNLILMQNYTGEVQAIRVQISTATFWIRLYDLLLGAMNEKVVSKIGNSIGVVEEIDVEKDEVAWGEFIKIRILLDVTKPLLRGKCINLGNHGSCWVRFTYERLPTFCYGCGRLGHSHKDCSIWKNDQGACKEDNLPFGPLL
ncbi:uncharacterized protein LOC122293643 [Carya illinoinensis]|uniref:uncharacterized protein LOC122293643 n=1 Tax=Carya illinoinensis TaxID=32201 RepID=UPI001C71C81A|nr:uncharacterized protein LOC122293643 [Carya illinoinensis]